jgi:hypothetical protein
MKPSQPETPTTPTHPEQLPEQLPHPNSPPSTAGNLLADIRWSLLASDFAFEVMMDRIANWFSPRAERAQEFFGPALSGFVGYAIFSLFDRLGVGNLAHGGSAKALFAETAKSFENPFFLLGMFLLALAALTGSGNGRNIIARWLVAPFLDLVQHVCMLGLGVVVAVAIGQLFDSVEWVWTAKFVGACGFLLTVAYVSALGVDFCKGRWANFFENHRGRRVLVVAAGAILAFAGVKDLVRYAHAQQEKASAHSAPGERQKNDASSH